MTESDRQDPNDLLAQALNPRDYRRGSREVALLDRLMWIGFAISLVFATGFGLLYQMGVVVYGAAAAIATLALALMYLALRAVRRQLGVPMVFAVSVVGTSAAALAVAIASGQGISSLALVFSQVLLFAAATRLTTSATAALALLQGVALVALIAAQADGRWTGWLGRPPPPDEWMPALLIHFGLFGAALGFGHLMRQALAERKSAARARERRFASLFSVVADSFWEIDGNLQFAAVAEKSPEPVDAGSHPWVGKSPWDVDELQFDPQVLDAFRADLESRLPFVNVLLSINDPNQGTRWMTLSGRPRFDERGVFHGYWVVGRDASAEQTAEIERAASEARYRELFARSPSPLVVHRDTYVIDANTAALNLLGLRLESQLLGRSLLDIYDKDDGSRERAQQREEQLRQLPIGQSAPPQAFVLRAVNGRRMHVQVSSVMINAEGGPAVLSIFVDETERLRAESARERTEALLAHVVTISPDVMTLVDLQTGRCVLVNDAFVNLSGWSREESIGRTIAELGVWPDPQAWQRIAQEARESTRVEDRHTVFHARDGRQGSLIVSGLRFVMEGRDYLVLNGRDVTNTERERLEHAAVLDNASIGIAMTREQRFVMANPRFEQMFGWAHNALVGEPEQVLSASPADHDQLVAQISAPLDCGEPVEFERTVQCKDGGTFVCRFLARAVDRSSPGVGATIWIAEDVTEKRAVESALARARDDAEAANRAKSAFLANTSHEIRTPLNGMVGLARLARQAGLDEHRRARYLEQIDESAKALAGVISDILDLSKIEAGRLTLESVPFDLHTLIESIEHGYQALAEVRALSLRMVVAPDVPRRVMGDPVRVRQVLTNFLNNALKFTDRGGVRLTVKALGKDRLRFEVQDTGPGISAAVKARLFLPFSQADVSTTRRFGGTGLGLSICRELAHLMQGEVGVESEPGRGSMFWAELPLPATGEASLQSAFGSLESEGGPLTGMQVLVVEDNPVNMMIAVALLEQWGVTVTQAVNGVEAIDCVEAQAAQAGMFDLVLMDMQMPVMGGHETTRRLRERHDARALPIVALTAAAITSERDSALEAGMNDFLTKPIDAQRLHDTLLRWRDPSTSVMSLLDKEMRAAGA